jgi:molybdopterin-guanine dinucleotide biosynthesis protein A
MGRDKALLEVDGVPMALRVAQALREAGAAEVFGVGGDSAGLTAAGLRVVPDRWPGEGPLGGLVTALRAAVEDVIVVLACDLPSMGPTTVGALLEGLGDADGADGAVAVVGSRAQHVVGAWRRRALVSLEAAFVSGERAVWRACRSLRVTLVTLRAPNEAADADNPDAAVLRGRMW